MKATVITRTLAAALMTLGLWSCTPKSDSPSPLIAQSERLDGVFSELAEKSADFLDSASVKYADKALSFSFYFAPKAVDVAIIDEALVQFVMSEYMKANTGPNLDEIVNTLTKEEGKMVVKLAGDGAEKSFDVSASRVRNLIKLKPMELNFAAAKENFADLMAAHAAYYTEYADKQNAKTVEPAEFGIVAGFAQYTFTFDNVSAYKALKQSQLTGRFMPAVNESMLHLGECRPIVEDLMKTFGIEGYRFIFANKKDEKILRAAITWSMIK